MTDLFIENRHSYSRVIEREHIKEEGLRVFQDAPGQMHMQVRTCTERQGRMTGLSISRDNAELLIAYLSAWLKSDE